MRPAMATVVSARPWEEELARLATSGARVRLVAVEGGVYDLGKAYEILPPTERERLRFITGGTAKEKPDAYKKRSPIYGADRLQGPVLILHSRNNRRFPLSEAENLAAALKNQSHPFRLVITEGQLGAYSVKQESLKKWVIPFMREHLKFQE